MERKEFLDCLSRTAAYELEISGKKYLLGIDKTIDFPDGSGRIYPDWESFFAVSLGEMSVGEAVDALQDYCFDYVYHLPVRFYDPEGRRIDD
ncbi:MAG: hypothetical protein IKE21_04400 [Erysipelotrichaceae bacterium]|nr:hypothetical protein [Erysipelotrichaceae bacterium]